MSIDAWAQVAIFTRTWTWCGRCKMLRQVVYWVELPVQRRLCPIFVSGVGLTGCQRDTPGLGRHISSDVSLDDHAMYHNHHPYELR